jgi:hypothetical protein
MYIMAVSGHSGRGTDVRMLRQVKTSSNGSFEIELVITCEAIADYLAADVGRLRLGGADEQNLLITGIVVAEIPAPLRTIYNIEWDSNLPLFAGHGTSQPSTHQFLASNSGTRTIFPLQETEAIAITGRGGTSQGVDIRLSAVAPLTRVNHTYTFGFGGWVTSGTGDYSVFINAVSGTSGGTTLQQTNNTPNQHFWITYNATHEQIMAHIGSGFNGYRLGGAGGRDMVIHEIVVYETCLINCC